MKRAYINTDVNKKIKYLEKINNKVIILPKRFLKDIENLEIKRYFLLEDINSKVQFFNFQSLLNKETSLVFYNCMRYKTYNCTVYNKLYRLAEDNKNNTYVVDNFPFYFDRRNIYVLFKLLNIEPYHAKQFFDNNFYTKDNLQANSLKALKNLIKDNIEFESTTIKQTIIYWGHTQDEQKYYDDFKKKLIYEKKYGKQKVITWLQGESNRFKSKINKLKHLTKDKQFTILTNWERAIKALGEVVDKKSLLTSYHQKQSVDMLNRNNIAFFETIISQKIMFYDILALYFYKDLYFFINNGLGADKIVTGETIQIIKELNEFYKL